jgi:hypothetical protein
MNDTVVLISIVIGALLVLAATLSLIRSIVRGEVGWKVFKTWCVNVLDALSGIG